LSAQIELKAKSVMGSTKFFKLALAKHGYEIRFWTFHNCSKSW